MNSDNNTLIIKVLSVFIIVSTFLCTCCLSSEEPMTYVLFTIDTERDFPPYINTYQGMDEGIPILIDLFERHGVRATFFTTGNVALQRSELISSLAEFHEIGCHGLFHEEPLYDLSYEEKRSIIEMSTSILSTVTGSEITSFRSPYHASDTDVYNILESLGYHVESSAYAGDDRPYHPSSDDWKKEGDMKLLHIPITSDEVYFYPYNTYPLSWVDVFEKAVESKKGNEHIIIVIGLHPWELCDLESYPLFSSYLLPCGDYTISQISSLLDYLDTKNVSYITMEEAYELFN